MKLACLPTLLLSICVAVILVTVRSVEDACEASDDGACSPKEEDTVNSKPWLEEGGWTFIRELLRVQIPGQKLTKVEGKDRDNSDSEHHESFGMLYKDQQQQQSASSGYEEGTFSTLKDILTADDPAQAVMDFILGKKASQKDSQAGTSMEDMAGLFMEHAIEIKNQLYRVVGSRLDVMMKEYFFLPSAWYLFRHEQEHKHPHWKTHQHRFFPKVTDTNYLRELHQALYLSDLAYADTETELRQGLDTVENGNWQLEYADMQGNPTEPAHFLCVEKQAANAPQEKPYFWQGAARKLQVPLADQDTLKVLIVVRGTKNLADMLSDGLLEATTFKGEYKAHGGIASSGQYIVNKHIAKLRSLLQASGRSKLQLLLLGHSLGAGTAAIAAMEFHDNYQDIMTVQAVGFGCPSLVSPELSEKYKDIITTVVADADVVPRMSGSSIVNLQLSMLSLDWTNYMWEDLKDLGDDIIKSVHELTSGVGTKFVKDLLESLGAFIQEKLAEVRPLIHECRDNVIPAAFSIRKVDTELIPPGRCLHLYRTATGFDAAYTPCSFFDEIEYVPHFVDDHMCDTGYHIALLTLLRQGLNDYNAVFENKLE